VRCAEGHKAKAYFRHFKLQGQTKRPSKHTGRSLFSLLFSYWYTKRSGEQRRNSPERKFHLLVCFFPFSGGGCKLHSVFPTLWFC